MWFLIPGLGADERVFWGLNLPGPVTVLSWLPPQSATEPLRHYAARLAEAVPTAQVCWLVGVSFGGLLALEIGRLRPLARVVLISSLVNSAQLPPLLKIGRATGLYRLVPFGLLPRLPRLAQWFFGARNGREYRLLSLILTRCLRVGPPSNCCSGTVPACPPPCACTAPTTGCCPPALRTSTTLFPALGIL
jgi:pimeloyl-ACP methyl ester carboxylesterase